MDYIYIHVVKIVFIVMQSITAGNDVCHVWIRTPLFFNRPAPPPSPSGRSVTPTCFRPAAPNPELLSMLAYQLVHGKALEEVNGRSAAIRAIATLPLVRGPGLPMTIPPPSQRQPFLYPMLVSKP